MDKYLENYFSVRRFCENAKDICAMKEIPVSEMEKELGLSKGTLSRVIRTGGHGLQFNKAISIAEYLGETIEDMIERDYTEIRKEVEKNIRISRLKEEAEKIESEIKSLEGK